MRDHRSVPLLLLATFIQACAEAPTPPSFHIIASSPDVASALERFDYGIGNLTDRNTATCWQVSSPRSGRFEWIELVFHAPADVTQLILHNGFQCVDPYLGDLYPLNARLRRIMLCVNREDCREHYISDDRGPIPVPVHATAVNRIRITVLDVHLGSEWPDDLAISEVEVR